MKQKDTESLRKIQSLYNYQRIEEERNRALLKKTTAERISFLSIIIVMTLLHII